MNNQMILPALAAAVIGTAALCTSCKNSAKQAPAEETTAQEIFFADPTI